MTPADVQQKIKIITYAMVASGMLFAMIASGIAISATTSNPVQGAFFDLKGAGPVPILTGIMFVMLMSELIARAVVSKAMAAQMQGLPPESLGERLIGLAVIRLALLQGVALFGSVVLLIAGTTEAINAAPYAWINLLPTVVMVFLSLKELPKEE